MEAGDIDMKYGYLSEAYKHYARYIYIYAYYIEHSNMHVKTMI